MTEPTPGAVPKAPDDPVTEAPRRPGRAWAIDVRPLRVPAYRRLWAGTSVSHFGFHFTAVAVPVELYALTRDSFWVGMLGIAGFVPLLIFGLWGGAIADAFDRRRLLLVSSTLAWLVTFGFLAQALLQLRSPWLLLVLTALQSAAFAVSSPTRNAVVPRLVPTAMVPAANTLNFTSVQAAMVIGPLTVGVIFAALPHDTALVVAYGVDALLFAVSLWAAYRLPPLPPAGTDEQTPRRVAGLRGVADGLRYLAAAPVLLLSFAIDVIAMVFAMPRALFPEIAEGRFGGGTAIGWLYAAISIGSVLGGLTSGWIGRIRRQGLGLTIAVVGWGLAVAAAGLAGSLWLMVLLLAVAGAADLVSAVLRQSILLVYAPDRMRGRLQGVNSVVIAGGPRLGDLRAGAMGAMYGGMIAWVAGGLLAALLAVLLVAFFPVLLRYRSPDPGTDPDSVPDADPGSDTEAGAERSVGAGNERR